MNHVINMANMESSIGTVEKYNNKTKLDTEILIFNDRLEITQRYLSEEENNYSHYRKWTLYTDKGLQSNFEKVFKYVDA